MTKDSSTGSLCANNDHNRGNKRFLIAGIGASAGGLEALQSLLRSTPPDIDMALIVVTHQHPEHSSLLAELLVRETSMTVKLASDGISLEPGHVYVNPPGSYLQVLKGKLYCKKIARQKPPALPIDYFFRSLAEDAKGRVIAIVLSGNGSDGTLGLRYIKAEAGMVMAQEPLSARFAGMPASAIASGLVDHVLRPQDMGPQLVVYTKLPYSDALKQGDDQLLIEPETLNAVFLLLRNRTGQDFSNYKDKTVCRRIQRRMNVHQIRGPEQYLRYLQQNANEIDLLFKDLLITVTRFFRDAEAWEVLGQQLQALVSETPSDQPLRAWVPGCATGEEAYSLGILLLESMRERGTRRNIQIFATDLDSGAIDSARTGLYPEGIVGDISGKRLQKFFNQENGDYRVSKELREMVVFAEQNLIKDPPFTKLDIVCCRNLMIYLDSELQQRILPMFHYALKPGGILFLGSSESLGACSNLFEPINKRWNIYRSIGGALTFNHFRNLPATVNLESQPELKSLMANLPTTETQLTKLIEQMLMERFVPVSVIVNERGDIHYIHGHSGRYLEPTRGRPRHNILEMAREGLQIELASAIRACSKTGNDVVRQNIPVKDNGDRVPIELSVSMIVKPEGLRQLLLVTFRPMPKLEKRKVKKKSPREGSADMQLVEALEQELQHMKESHQLTLEELETSNEELKSANEELQSTNEEMQSTNEELKTSKEEMQSLNEELTTVNSELQAKVEELSKSNDDMQNLLNSTDIATIFLDNDFQIKRFTQQATKIVALRNTDIGRPIFELKSHIRYPSLQQDCESVLKTLASTEVEVETLDGVAYLMRIMPYRTSDNVIEGLVLTFINVHRRKLAEMDSREKEYFRSIFNAVIDPLVVLDGEMRIVSANQSFYQNFNLECKQVEGALLNEIGAGRWDNSRLQARLQKILTSNDSVAEFELPLANSESSSDIYYLNARRLTQSDGKPDLILLSMSMHKP